MFNNRKDEIKFFESIISEINKCVINILLNCSRNSSSLIFETQNQINTNRDAPSHIRWLSEREKKCLMIEFKLIKKKTKKNRPISVLKVDHLWVMAADVFQTSCTELPTKLFLVISTLSIQIDRYQNST